ncbi:MAG TPA: hypothetical protein VFA70_04205, partial [Dehalococcoidia bacterium]|nr:hypothetical protein [Dehalococcoidia bacterium]
AVAGGVTDPRLLAQAAAVRASILLDAARGDAARGDYATAVRRLAQVEAIEGAGSAAATAAQLLPHYQVGEAGALTGAGNGVDAVTLLDAVSAAGNGALAAPVYPPALLAAGLQELSAGAPREAVADLQRLTQNFPGTSQAARAQAMLAAPQAVTGTLVDRSGHPISGQVRLSSHFFNEPGGYYTTGPFYYSNADSTGTFRVTGVPVGGPYVLEVYRDGDWTTYVDPATGQPSTPVTVTPMQPVDLTFVELP